MTIKKITYNLSDKPFIYSGVAELSSGNQVSFTYNAMRLTFTEISDEAAAAIIESEIVPSCIDQ